ncbi:MAG: MFS transporter [Pseudomonadota bacterium]|nr:MFS transporter [Pseudomonadota bacterium]
MEQINHDRGRDSTNSAINSGLLVVFLGACFYCYEYLLRVSPSVMYSQLMQHYQINDFELTSLIACYYTIYAPMQLPVGLIVDRYNPYRVLVFACFCCSIGTAFFVGTQVILLAKLGRLLVGFGSSFAFVGVLKIAALSLPKHYFSIITSITMALGMVGALLGDVFLSHLIMRSDWQIANIQTALFGLCLLICMLFAFSRHQHRYLVHKKYAHITGKQVFNQMLDLFKNPYMWLIGIMGLMMCAPVAVFAELFSIDFIKVTYQISSHDASYITGLFFIGMACGGPSLTYITTKGYSKLSIIRVSCLVTSCLLALLIYAQISYQMLNLTVFVLGFFTSSKVLIFSIAREQTSTKSAGTAVALINMMVMMSGIIFQPLSGFILNQYALPHTTTDYLYALAYVPLVLLLVAPLSLCVKDNIQSHQPS